MCLYRLPVCVCLIRRLCPCDLTFRITTLARAGGRQGGAVGAPGQSALSAQHQAGGPHPHPLQSKDRKKWLPTPHPTDAPGTWSPVFYLTLQRGLFQGVPRARSERPSPTSPPRVSARELSPEGEARSWSPGRTLALSSGRWLSPGLGA